jgi:hypothetical protein
MHQKNTTIVLILALAALCFNQSQAQYDLTTISNPGPFYDTWAYGISGTNIVGCYDSVNDGHGSLQGFLYDGSTFTTLTVPDAIYFTEAFGISGHNIVGSYGNNNGFYGFLYDGTSYTTLSVPGANATYAYGISGNQVVGYYQIAAVGSYTNQGFLYNGGTYTTLSVPGAVDTYPQGICGHNIVGYYDYGTDTYDDPINPQGFLYDGTNYITLSVPGGSASLDNDIGVNPAGAAATAPVVSNEGGQSFMTGLLNFANAALPVANNVKNLVTQNSTKAANNTASVTGRLTSVSASNPLVWLAGFALIGLLIFLLGRKEK